jgi:hypothetical protein
MNDLITRLDLEHKHGVDTENYERAEIFYRLTQIFMEIQYEED